MVKARGFSLYDVEQFLREAGAEKVNEKAVLSFERELEDYVNELIDEAALYAHYAGRKRVIKSSDIALLSGTRSNHKRILVSPRTKTLKKGRKKMYTMDGQEVEPIKVVLEISNSKGSGIF